MNIRRRAIINSNESLDYIKDGLVFHLDGVDATPSLWTDRIGGKEFTMTGVTIDSAKGGVVFHGSGSRGRNTSSIYYSKDTCTIEIVVNNRSTANPPEFVAFSNTQGGISAYLTSGCGYNALNKASGVTKFVIDSITGLYTISFAGSNGYKNKVKLSTNGTNSFGGSDTGTYIGCRDYNTNQNKYRACLIGTLYQIRIYNRLLTEDEILYNQTIDMQKYNIS